MSLGGMSYIVSFLDETSLSAKLLVLKRQKEVNEAFKLFKSQFEKRIITKFLLFMLIAG